MFHLRSVIMRKLVFITFLLCFFPIKGIAADYAGTATGAELDFVAGVTSAIQDQLNAKQASDSELSALAGLTSAANKLPYFTGSGTAGLIDLGAFASTLLGYADAAAVLAGIGAEAAGAAAALQADDLVTLSGLAIGSMHLGTFTGTTITDNQTIKASLQLLETALEGINDHATVTIGTANGLSLSTQQLSLAAATSGGAGAMTAAQVSALEAIDTEAELEALLEVADLADYPLTTAGDLFVGGASGAPSRLAIGTAYQILQTNSGGTAAEWTTTPTFSVFNLPSSDSDPSTVVGRILHDTIVANHANGAVRWWDGTSIRQVIDMVAATAQACTDDQVVAYDADADLFYCKDDSTGAGSLGTNLSSTTNDITTDNSIFQLADSNLSEDLVFTFTANTMTVTSTTSMATFDFGALALASTGFDASDGNIANVGNIALDSISADATNVLFGSGAATQLQFRDTALHIASLDDGHLDLTADTSIDLNGTVVTSGAIELGAASDTTIARSGAGAITVEGSQVILASAFGANVGTALGVAVGSAGAFTINGDGNVNRLFLSDDRTGIGSPVAGDICFEY